MTPEQHEAQDQLERAVSAHVKAFRSDSLADNPEMATDWVVIACVTSFDGDERMTAYHMGFSGGEMDDHRASGLCRVAERLIFDGERQE